MAGPPQTEQQWLVAAFDQYPCNGPKLGLTRRQVLDRAVLLGIILPNDATPLYQLFDANPRVGNREYKLSHEQKR